MKYEIGWTFGGYATVEAESEQEARDKFHALAGGAVLRSAWEQSCEGLDIVNVSAYQPKGDSK